MRLENNYLISKCQVNYCKCIFDTKGVSMLAIVLAIVLLLGLAGTGTYFYLRHTEASHREQLITEAQNIQEASEQYWLDKGRVFWDSNKKETESSTFIAEIDSSGDIINGRPDRLPQRFIDTQGKFELQDIIDNLGDEDTAKFFDIDIAELESEGYITALSSHPGYFIALNPTGYILIADPDDEITEKRISEIIAKDTDGLDYDIPAGFIPVANRQDLEAIGGENEHVFAAGTPYMTERVVGTMQDNYFMVEDIELGSDNFYPIGYSPGSNYEPFTGVFNGNNLKVYEGRIEHPDDSYIGLFAYNEGIIANIKLEEISVRGNQYTGSLVGANWNGTGEISVERVSVNGNKRVGGLTGFNRGVISAVEISDIDVNGDQNYVGGLAGENANGIIEASSISSSDIRGLNHIGGLAGHQNWEGLTETSSVDEIRVDGIDRVGGLIGANDKGEIIESVARGEIYGKNRVGGIVGCNSGFVCSVTSEAIVDSSGIHAGGIAGRNYEGEVANSVAKGEVRGGVFVGGLIGWSAGNSLVELSYTRNEVSGENHVGGLIGQNSNSDIRLSFSSVYVRGRQYTGSLVGSNNGHIEESHARGNAEGDYHTGGFVGANLSGGRIENAYSRGDVEGTRLFTGGLAGSNSGIISNAYTTGETSVQRGEITGGLIGWNRGGARSQSLYWLRRDSEQPGVAQGDRDGVKSASSGEIKSGKPGDGLYQGWEAPPWEFISGQPPIFGWE